MTEKWKRLSKGAREFVRSTKKIAREQIETEEFRRNSKRAIEVIQRACNGVEYSSDWGLVLEYWNLRHKYFDEEGSKEYKDALGDFNNRLPENPDLKLSTALRIISSNFARHLRRS